MTTVSNIGFCFGNGITGFRFCLILIFETEVERITAFAFITVQLVVEFFFAIGIASCHEQQQQKQKDKTTTEGNLIHRIVQNTVNNVTRKCLFRRRYWLQRLWLLGLRDGRGLGFRWRFLLGNGRLLCHHLISSTPFDITTKRFFTCNICFVRGHGAIFFRHRCVGRFTISGFINLAVCYRFFSGAGTQITFYRCCRRVSVRLGHASVGRGRRLFLRHHTLHVRQLAVLQLQQPLQGLNLILQILDTGIELVIFAFCGFQLFHRNCGTGINTARQITITTGRTTVFGRPGFRFIGNQQAQLITRCRLSSALACCGLGGIRCINGSRRLEFLVLLCNYPVGFSAATAPNLIQRGNPQHLTTLQAVNIPTNERVRILILNREHNLLHGNRTIRTYLLGNSPECVGGTCRTKRICLIAPRH